MPAKLVDLVSEPRFARYRSHAKNDEPLAEELYAFNLRLASSAFKAIQMCEVVVRNSMDRELRAWNVKQGEDAGWTLTPAPMLKGCFYDNAKDLREAKSKADRAVSGGRPVVHDDVLAQMSFGAWRYLLPPRGTHHAKQRIWDDALVNAFPNKSAHTPVTSLASWLGIAYDFRNRVAHHEPVYHLDLQAKRRAMADIVDAVSRDAKKWFVSQDVLATDIREFQQFVSRNKIKLG
ncbi:Abi family protein [Frigoribacterium sp. CFBP 8754]|uniref:Abi family protein n=1 Tax=Frigoribacterium sp. CFBP 8754 TaxID=2775290 RepID=UPI00177DC446|nr:Abi family protein [Frigoribacterium sp. CFBP 8754]MBD8660499.1 Abi family protein [Frigoribacterium sp. CFBP 8754]